MSKTQNNNAAKVQSILNKNNKISVKVVNLEGNTIKQMEQLLLYTLQFYKMDVWLDYFSLLTRGLIFFAIKSCQINQCSIRLIKENNAFVIQVFSEGLNQSINKREFIEFINDLSVYESVPELFSDLFFLKKLFEIKEINTDNISYSSDKLELFIPQEKLDEKTWMELRNAIISSIDELPPLKENLLKLEKMIHMGTFDMDSIAEQVGTDPALTIDILKIVNSGAFVLSSRIDDIQSALKYLGLRELYNLMISLSIKKTLSLYDKEMNEFWYHSYKCAYYSCELARRLKINVAHSDSIYTSALLHDIGKFPISMLFDDENDVILDYCVRYKITLSDIEDALSGIRHCETGFFMAEKWNLPDSLKLIMKFHHSPGDAPESIRNLNDIIYMADCLIYSEAERFDLSTIDPDVLKRHKIASHVELLEKFTDLTESFDSQNIWK